MLTLSTHSSGRWVHCVAGQKHCAAQKAAVPLKKKKKRTTKHLRFLVEMPLLNSLTQMLTKMHYAVPAPQMPAGITHLKMQSAVL